MELILKINNRINRIVGYFGIIVCVGAMLMMVSDICMRYFFNKPFSFSLEVVQLSLVLMVYSFIPYSTNSHRHVSIEFLVQKFPKKIRAFVDGIGDVASALLLFVICQQSYLQGVKKQMFHTRTGELGIPLFPFYYFVAFGALLACISLCIAIVASFRKKGKG